MFGNQFYPTPDSLVDKMIQPFIRVYAEDSPRYRFTSLSVKKILEPSAGKGNILDHLIDKYHTDSKNVACIELNPELRMILGSKKYRIVDADFLEYECDESFDLIIMNPPFRDGVEHLLKAWEIAQKHVCCILNAETIRNPYTEKRELLLQLIQEHGRYEFHGEQFMDAENPTDVEIAIVWMEKPEKEKTVEFEGFYEQEYTPKVEEFSENALASRNVIEALVAQYESAKQILVDIHEHNSRLKFYIKNLYIEDKRETVRGTLQESLDTLKIASWKYVFERTKIGRVTTSKFQKDFDAFSSSTQNMAFSVRNIMSVLELFLLNKNAILERCLLETFDAACAFHKDNKIHWEGWKTNSFYKCNRKIIMPYGITWDPKWNNWSDNWTKRDFFMDMDKVMCFLTGANLEGITTIAEAVNNRVHFLNDNKHIDHRGEFFATFFWIKFFKKGTIHIEFQDEDLWNKFNVRAAQGKNWLGADGEAFEQSKFC